MDPSDGPLDRHNAEANDSSDHLNEFNFFSIVWEILEFLLKIVVEILV